MEYPREWFRVCRFSTEPEAQTFVRETEVSLFKQVGVRQQRVAKENSWETWYPTREEGQAVIDRRQALLDANRKVQALKARAPELRTAVVDLFHAVASVVDKVEVPILTMRLNEIEALLKETENG